MDKRSILREWTDMKQKDMYTLDELCDNLIISLSEFSELSGVNEGTLARMRKGYSARRKTVNRLLAAFSEVYGIELSLGNVTGIILEDKKAIRKQMLERKGISEKSEEQPAPTKTTKAVAEKPQKRKYKPREVDLPEGCILASKFAEQHGVPRPTFTHHMLIGLGPGTVPGELGDPMLSVKEQPDYSERDHPSRKGETERYLTPAQQSAALDFWKRHGVPFTMPETEQGAKQEAAWYLPD
jgi:hypothetical protein